MRGMRWLVATMLAAWCAAILGCSQTTPPTKPAPDSTSPVKKPMNDPG
jgi:hypothetical protein